MNEAKDFDDYKDITQEEFFNKKKNFFEIPDNKLIHAAGYAIAEANELIEITLLIYETKRKLSSTICLNGLLSIELYFKAILFLRGINVTKEKYGHDIYKMFQEFPTDLQEKVKRNIEIDNVVKNDFLKIKIHFDSFEEELKFISKDFNYLRYHYEKFLNGKVIFTLSDFIIALAKNARSTSMGLLSDNIISNN